MLVRAFISSQYAIVYVNYSALLFIPRANTEGWTVLLYRSPDATADSVKGAWVWRFVLIPLSTQPYGCCSSITGLHIFSENEVPILSTGLQNNYDIERAALDYT